MATHKFLAVVLTGTTSLIGIQMFASQNTLVSHFLKRSSFDLNFISPALSNTPIPTTSAMRYVPPLVGKPKKTELAGTRGSCPGFDAWLTLLIPSPNQVGQTTSGHPTFFWYLSNNMSVPIEFTLREENVDQPLFVKRIEMPKAGIMQMKMPSSLPELKTGREYNWSVQMICNPLDFSGNFSYESWIERVPTVPLLEQQLATRTSIRDLTTRLRNTWRLSPQRDRALVYARSGLWYEALEAISAAWTANPKDASIREDLVSLLNQVGLIEVAAQVKPPVAKPSFY